MANFRARLTLTACIPSDLGVVVVIVVAVVATTATTATAGLPGLFAFANRAGARFDPLSSPNKATPTPHLHKIARRSHLSGNDRSLRNCLAISRDFSQDQWRLDSTLENLTSRYRLIAELPQSSRLRTLLLPIILLSVDLCRTNESQLSRNLFSRSRSV